jgi:hypothetical protein
MAAREASGNAELAGLLRERESLSTELDRLDQQMKQAVLQTAAHARGRSGGADSARMDAISQRLAAIDATVGRDFPGYLSLARPQPLTIAEVQAILRLDEALVVMVATPALGPDTTPDPNLPAWIARANTQLKCRSGSRAGNSPQKASSGS